MFFYYAQRLEPVTGLRDDVDPAHLAEQETQLVAGKLLIVYDNGAERRRAVHSVPHAVILVGTTSSGMTTRAHVPSPGTLSSCSW